jgi:hypothetical protein
VIARAKLWLSALLLGCGAQDKLTPEARDVPFACRTDAECGEGDCQQELGICTSREGQLTTLLFEVTPQASEPVYGGARFLKIMHIGEDAEVSSPLELNVRPRVPVRGQVIAPLDQPACLSSARSTLPVSLTFTPRQRLLGLSLPSYELVTRFIDRPIAEYEFTGALPPGRYDVYVQPITSALNEDCRAIPQLFRDQIIEEMSGRDLRLQQPTPASLRLRITWRPDLEGWLLDMVHPVTGEIISNRVRLSAANVNTEDQLETTLSYSRGEDDFGGQAGQELVRLTPPPGVFAATVFFIRSGLELFAGEEGEIGDVSFFGSPVEFRAWVWKKDARDIPVPGTVSFSALDLDDVPEGVPGSSFEGSADVDARGQVNAHLLPGRYRVRVTPPAVGSANLGSSAGFESEITVWPRTEDGALQSGQVIPVPPARRIAGRVVAAGSNLPIPGLEVRASASNAARDACVEGRENEQNGGCDREYAPVLLKARAQDPFVPRTRNAFSEADGEFELNGLDCGRCEDGASARFDVTVRPDVEAGLPWSILKSIDPDSLRGTESLELRMPMPVVRPMRVTYGDPLPLPAGSVVDPTVERRRSGLGGARVRVFALLDDQSAPVADPENLIPCIALATSSREQCLQSVLQVAEVRTGSDGEFLLLLPPNVE